MSRTDFSDKPSPFGNTVLGLCLVCMPLICVHTCAGTIMHAVSQRSWLESWLHILICPLLLSVQAINSRTVGIFCSPIALPGILLRLIGTLLGFVSAIHDISCRRAPRPGLLLCIVCGLLILEGRVHCLFQAIELYVSHSQPPIYKGASTRQDCRDWWIL